MLTPIPRVQYGFTLIESIMVIVITGVLAGMVAIFIKGPVDSYFDMARRAELTDVADIVVRRMARDLRLALPNTVRNPSGGTLDQCVEFMPTKAGGRYRANQTASSTGDILDFSVVDTSFDMLGLNSSLPIGGQIGKNDLVVVYNDGFGGNAYTGSNAIMVDDVVAGDTTGTSKIKLSTTGAGLFVSKRLPSESPSYRFQVIPAGEHVVSYACSGNTLFRYTRTLTSAWAQPADCAAMVAGATVARLATGVTPCSMLYQPPGSGLGAGRFGIVSISLTMTQNGESVNLYHQVSVGNAP